MRVHTKETPYKWQVPKKNQIKYSIDHILIDNIPVRIAVVVLLNWLLIEIIVGFIRVKNRFIAYMMTVAKVFDTEIHFDDIYK